MENETGDIRQTLIEQGSVLYEQWTDKYGPHLRRIPVGEVSHLLGKYLNTMVADLGIEGKGQYLRDLFSRYEAELIEPTRQTIDERAEFEKYAVSKGFSVRKEAAHDNIYWNPSTQQLWEAWQARAKLGQSYRGLDPTSDAPQKHGVEGDDR